MSHLLEVEHSEVFYLIKVPETSGFPIRNSSFFVLSFEVLWFVLFQL
jgi:hypothetical protein